MPIFRVNGVTVKSIFPSCIVIVLVGWMDWLVEWSHACAVLLSGRAADLGGQSWAGRAADLGCRAMKALKIILYLLFAILYKNIFLKSNYLWCSLL